jgi:hypothetical protein
VGARGILTAGTVSKCKGRIAPIAAAGTLPSLLVGTPSRGGTPSVGAGSFRQEPAATAYGKYGSVGGGLESAGHIPLAAVLFLRHLALRHIGGWAQGCGLEQWTGTLGQGANVARTHSAPSGFGLEPTFPNPLSKWVRVGSRQWVRETGGFAVGSRQGGFLQW